MRASIYAEGSGREDSPGRTASPPLRTSIVNFTAQSYEQVSKKDIVNRLRDKNPSWRQKSSNELKAADGDDGSDEDCAKYELEAPKSGLRFRDEALPPLFLPTECEPAEVGHKAAPPVAGEALSSVGSGRSSDLREVIYCDDSASWHAYNESQPSKAGARWGLTFDSKFECGNLMIAESIVRKNTEFGAPEEYDLYLRPDPSTEISSHGEPAMFANWFLFRVQGVKSRAYRFHIHGFTQAQSPFSQGMKPVVLSEYWHGMEGRGWQRIGDNITYLPCSREPLIPYPTYSHSYINDQPRFTLSFTFHCLHAKDCLYFASAPPYTYTQLQHAVYICAKNPQNHAHLRIHSSCRSLAGNRCDLLVITENGSLVREEVTLEQLNENDDLHSALHAKMFNYHLRDVLPAESSSSAMSGGGPAGIPATLFASKEAHSGRSPDSELRIPKFLRKVEAGMKDEQLISHRKKLARIRKPAVVILARTQGSDVCSSWMCEGLVKFLLGDEEDAKRLREKFVFYIIPMVNPDGVINGLSRFDLVGQDLHFHWQDDELTTQPIVRYIQLLVRNLSQTTNMAAIIEFRGQAREGAGGWSWKTHWRDDRTMGPTDRDPSQFFSSMAKLSQLFSLSTCSLQESSPSASSPSPSGFFHYFVRNQQIPMTLRVWSSCFRGLAGSRYHGSQLMPKDYARMGMLVAYALEEVYCSEPNASFEPRGGLVDISVSEAKRFPLRDMLTAASTSSTSRPLEARERGSVEKKPQRKVFLIGATDISSALALPFMIALRPEEATESSRGLRRSDRCEEEVEIGPEVVSAGAPFDPNQWEATSVGSQDNQEEQGGGRREISLRQESKQIGDMWFCVRTTGMRIHRQSFLLPSFQPGVVAALRPLSGPITDMPPEKPQHVQRGDGRSEGGGEAMAACNGVILAQLAGAKPPLQSSVPPTEGTHPGRNLLAQVQDLLASQALAASMEEKEDGEEDVGHEEEEDERGEGRGRRRAGGRAGQQGDARRKLPGKGEAGPLRSHAPREPRRTSLPRLGGPRRASAQSGASSSLSAVPRKASQGGSTVTSTGVSAHGEKNVLASEPAPSFLPVQETSSPAIPEVLDSTQPTTERLSFSDSLAEGKDASRSQDSVPWTQVSWAQDMPWAAASVPEESLLQPEVGSSPLLAEMPSDNPDVSRSSPPIPSQDQAQTEPPFQQVDAAGELSTVDSINACAPPTSASPPSSPSALPTIPSTPAGRIASPSSAVTGNVHDEEGETEDSDRLRVAYSPHSTSAVISSSYSSRSHHTRLSNSATLPSHLPDSEEDDDEIEPVLRSPSPPTVIETGETGQISPSVDSLRREQGEVEGEEPHVFFLQQSVPAPKPSSPPRPVISLSSPMHAGTDPALQVFAHFLCEMGLDFDHLFGGAGFIAPHPSIYTLAETSPSKYKQSRGKSPRGRSPIHHSSAVNSIGPMTFSSAFPQRRPLESGRGMGERTSFEASSWATASLLEENSQMAWEMIQSVQGEVAASKVLRPFPVGSPALADRNVRLREKAQAQRAVWSRSVTKTPKDSMVRRRGKWVDGKEDKRREDGERREDRMHKVRALPPDELPMWVPPSLRHYLSSVDAQDGQPRGEQSEGGGGDAGKRREGPSWMTALATDVALPAPSPVAIASAATAETPRPNGIAQTCDQHFPENSSGRGDQGESVDLREVKACSSPKQARPELHTVALTMFPSEKDGIQGDTASKKTTPLSAPRVHLKRTAPRETSPRVVYAVGSSNFTLPTPVEDEGREGEREAAIVEKGLPGKKASASGKALVLELRAPENRHANHLPASPRSLHPSVPRVAGEQSEGGREARGRGEGSMRTVAARTSNPPVEQAEKAPSEVDPGGEEVFQGLCWPYNYYRNQTPTTHIEEAVEENSDALVVDGMLMGIKDPTSTHGFLSKGKNRRHRRLQHTMLLSQETSAPMPRESPRPDNAQAEARQPSPSRSKEVSSASGHRMAPLNSTTFQFPEVSGTPASLPVMVITPTAAPSVPISTPRGSTPSKPADPRPSHSFRALSSRVLQL